MVSAHPTFHPQASQRFTWCLFWQHGPVLVLIGSVFIEPGEDAGDLGDEVARTRGNAMRSLLDVRPRGPASTSTGKFSMEITERG